MLKLTKLVDQLLEKYERCRNSDTELFIGVLHMRGLVLDENQREILRSTNLESVRRYRQKLQEQGKYPPSPEVAKKRRLKGYIVEQTAPSSTPEQLQKRIEEIPQ